MMPRGNGPQERAFSGKFKGAYTDRAVDVSASWTWTLIGLNFNLHKKG